MASRNVLQLLMASAKRQADDEKHAAVLTQRDDSDENFFEREVKRSKRPVSSSAAAPAPAAAAAAKSSPARREEQLYLDLGQSNFSTTCSKCGMFYHPGRPEDDTAHASYCKRQQRLLSGTVPWLATFSEKDIARTNKPLQHAAAEVCSIYQGDRRFAAPSDLPAFHQRIIRAVDSDLGSSSCIWCGDTAESDAKSSDHSKAMERRFMLYYAVLKRKSVSQAFVGGACVVEFPPASSSSSSSSWKLGIHRIWVHKNARRQAVATLLLDAARKHSFFGMQAMLPLSALAFSAPTSSGKLLARAYFGHDEYLVY